MDFEGRLNSMRRYSARGLPTYKKTARTQGGNTRLRQLANQDEFSPGGVPSRAEVGDPPDDLGLVGNLAL